MALQRFMAALAATGLFAAGVAAALAEPPATTTGDTTTATAPATTATTPTTIASTTTATATTTTVTTAATTTTTATTSTATRPTTTAVSPTTTSAASPAAATPAHELALDRACPIGAVALLLPNRQPTVLGPVANAQTKATQSSKLVYPADGSIATVSAVTSSERACTRQGPTSAEARLQDVSLFGGAVTADEITLQLDNSDSVSINGLEVDGKHIDATGERRIPLPWAEVVTGSHVPVDVPGGGQAIAALSVRLTHVHAGLPAGTTILVAVAGLRTGSGTTQAEKGRGTAKHKKRARAKHEPLKVTPPLGLRHYIFPVVGPSDYVDTYGAFRSDVPGNWHHGDDIFAPLGTPVVAVASGTINRVGWEELGGWRLWVRDSVGDEFYYAHLSGYAPTDLHSNRVTAGEVIGFIGNTGDAFTTSPHLHFEVHPRPLLHLGYDGAVDPTKYLDGWTRLQHVRAPRPTHPPLPRQPLIRREAAYVFRELLAARHLIKHAPKMSQRPHVPIPAGANGPPVAPRLSAHAAAPTPAGRTGMSTVAFAILVGLATLGFLAATMLLPRLRQKLKAAPIPADGAEHFATDVSLPDRLSSPLRRFAAHLRHGENAARDDDSTEV
jgi:murein DD-endopeptidase MepM/ murein hydrolase activator NlpD